MVGGKLSRYHPLRGADVFHIHRRTFHIQPFDLIGILKGVSGGPIGKGYELLRFIAAALISQHLIPHPGQQHLKRSCLIRCCQVFSGIGGITLPAGVGIIGISHRYIIPLHPQDVPDHPWGNVLFIAAVASALHLLGRQAALPVHYIQHGAAILQKGLIKILIVGIPVGILHIVIYPHPVDKIQRFRVILVVLIKSVVERLTLDGIDPNGIGPHCLDVPEPPPVGLFVYGKLRCPLARYPGAHIDPPDLKGLPALPTVQVDFLPIGLYKGRHGLLRHQINIPPQPVVCRIQCHKQQHQH